MPKQTGLGRGLDALFADNDTGRANEKVSLAVSVIEPNKKQPRTEFEKHALSELADSISENGVLQPIIVRPSGDGFYRIVAGERRWRAAKMAGLTEIPVIIVEVDERKAAEIALIENLQREDLSPVEEARAFKSLMTDFGLTQEDLSRRLGRSRPAVANALRLLDLPESVLSLLSEKKISPGHARALLGLEDKDAVAPMAERIAEKGSSVRAVEEAVKKKNAEKAKGKPGAPGAKKKVAVDYVKDLEDRVSAKLGRRFRLAVRKGAKVCEIAYSDDDDLQGLLEKLCGKRFFD